MSRPSLPHLLELVRRLFASDGERIANQLASTTNAERVIAVLSDAPRPRPFATPAAGRVQVVGGKLVDFKLTGYRVLIGQDRQPTAEEIKEVVAYGHGNPLGGWVGMPDFGWLVLEPRELIVTANTEAEAGTDVVICASTLEQRLEVLGNVDVERCIAAELPELAASDATLIATAMTSFIEAYDRSTTARDARTAG